MAMTGCVLPLGAAMDRQTQILVFVASSSVPTDPIRIMKGLFLFSQRVLEGKLPPQESIFTFDARDFGPMSFDIYRELELLVQAGLVKAIPVRGETWSQFVATEKGLDEANRRLVFADSQVVDYLTALRNWTSAISFSELLRSVYHAYPEYAKNSVLPHLRPNG